MIKQCDNCVHKFKSKSFVVCKECISKGDFINWQGEIDKDLRQGESEKQMKKEMGCALCPVDDPNYECDDFTPGIGCIREEKECKTCDYVTYATGDSESPCFKCQDTGSHAYWKAKNSCRGCQHHDEKTNTCHLVGNGGNFSSCLCSYEKQKDSLMDMLEEIKIRNDIDIVWRYKIETLLEEIIKKTEKQ